MIMTSLSEKSITVIETTRPELRYYASSWVLAEQPEKMRLAQERLHASTLFTDVDPVNFNTLEVAVSDAKQWLIADTTVLANFIAGLGWIGEAVIIYSQRSNSGEKTRRETAQVVEGTNRTPYYQIVAMA